MLEIKVKESTEQKGKHEVSIEMAGSVSTIIAEFCSVADSIKKSLGKADKNAEFIFVSMVTGTLFGLDKDDVVKTIKNVLSTREEAKKDAPVDKQN